MSDTSPLTPEQLAGFREELEAELRRLERSMRVSDEGLKPIEVGPTGMPPSDRRGGALTRS